MTKIDPNMTIAEILKIRPEAGEILMNHGMHCLGCEISTSESLAAAVAVHQIDLKKLLEELNAE